MGSKGKERRAVLVSATLDKSGVRVFLDDAVSVDESAKHWERVEHVTHKLIQRDQFERGEVGDQELADLGHYILSRLGAFMDREEL